MGVAGLIPVDEEPGFLQAAGGLIERIGREIGTGAGALPYSQGGGGERFVLSPVEVSG